MLFSIDQTGRKIALDKIPRRIVSLVPSQTELLYDLGLAEEVVGITKFCVHPPEWFHTKTRVGGTKQIKPEIIRELKPDLIIANKEENVKEQVEDLAKLYPVWISDVNTLATACDMISEIGLLTARSDRAGQIISGIKEKFARLRPYDARPRTAYLIWRDPYMTAGSDTFIHSMMELAGFTNIFADIQRYPEISVHDLAKRNCQVLLLSSEPFPFKQEHIDELQPALPNTRIIIVDGEMFSWYGSRLLQAPAYFQQISDRLKEAHP